MSFEKGKPMINPDKYIMFLQFMKGSDGSKYIQNVKYKLQKETSDAVYLVGKKKNWLNKFAKSNLNNRFIIGDIIRN